LEIFKNITTIKKAGSEVVINWYYEEDDDGMLESGENFQEITELPFNMIPVSSL
jgi:hypothetical protein